MTYTACKCWLLSGKAGCDRMAADCGFELKNRGVAIFRFGGNFFYFFLFLWGLAIFLIFWWGESFFFSFYPFYYIFFLGGWLWSLFGLVLSRLSTFRYWYHVISISTLNWKWYKSFLRIRSWMWRQKILWRQHLRKVSNISILKIRNSLGMTITADRMIKTILSEMKTSF